MIDISRAGTFALGTRRVKQVGYGAMQLAGPGVFGPPKDRQSALAVLREALASGVDHIDTSDYYGPHVTNHLIREALHPYPDNLVLVTKIGARRGTDASWNPAFSAEHLTSAVHDNLRHLKIDALDVVNLRLMFSAQGPAEGSIEAPLAVLAGLQRQGLLAHREDDALIDELAGAAIAYVPFFPLGGFTPLQSTALSDAAKALGATPMQVALAWLLQRAPNILLIPGTASLDHLRENLAAADLELPSATVAALNQIGHAAARH